jgi:hypothetical protein
MRRGSAIAAGLVLITAGSAAAQLDVFPSERQRPELPERLPEPERPIIELPPLELPPESTPFARGESVRVLGFRIEGNSVFDDAELKRLLTPYADRLLYSEDLPRITDRLGVLAMGSGGAGIAECQVAAQSQYLLEGSVQGLASAKRLTPAPLQATDLPLRAVDDSRCTNALREVQGAPRQRERLVVAAGLAIEDRALELRPGQAPRDASLLLERGSGAVRAHGFEKAGAVSRDASASVAPTWKSSSLRANASSTEGASSTSCLPSPAASLVSPAATASRNASARFLSGAGMASPLPGAGTSGAADATPTADATGAHGAARVALAPTSRTKAASATRASRAPSLLRGFAGPGCADRASVRDAHTATAMVNQTAMRARIMSRSRRRPEPSTDPSRRVSRLGPGCRSHGSPAPIAAVWLDPYSTTSTSWRP